MEQIASGNNTNWTQDMENDDMEAYRRHEKEVWRGFDHDTYDNHEDWSSAEYKRLDAEYDRRQGLEDDWDPMQYYDVVSQGKYHLQLERVSVEDVGEQFFDTADLKEMGMRASSGLFVDKHLMGIALGEQISMIPKGKKSVTMTDLELVDLMKENRISPSDLGHHDHCRRVDKVAIVYRKPKPPPAPPQSQPMNHDWERLAHCVGSICCVKYCIDVDAYGDCEWMEDYKANRIKALAQYRKMVTWKEMEAEIAEREFSDGRKWIKQIWSNGELHINNMAKDD